MEEGPKFTRHVWSQLWRLAKPFFFGRNWPRAWRLLTSLIVLSLAVTSVGIWSNHANGEFITSLQKRDSAGYYRALQIYLGTFALAIPLAAFYRYIEERLGVVWREVLVRTLMQRYFHNRAYYHLGANKEIDNPDQRISEDARNFTVTTLSFLLIVINSVIQIAGYTGVLWSISRLLVGVLIGYAVLGTLGTFLIGRKLIGLNYLQYEREADFRYGLVRVRENAESIAFYRGEVRELRDLKTRLGEAIANMLRLIKWNRNLAFFTTGYNYLALILPTIIVAPLFLQNRVEFGDITRAVGAFAVVLAAVSLIITQFERLSAFAAAVTRLGALWDYLDEKDAEGDIDNPDENIEIQEEDRKIVLEDLTVRVPSGDRELIRALTLTVPPHGSLLVMGESGSGKSSLLRTIAGLWASGEGSIGRPPYRKMMFLPQRPYMILGSLRAQLEYPGAAEPPTDDTLRETLEKVNLASLPDRVDGDFDRLADWANMLSLGEQQRLSFARLLLRNPAIAFLDESTSALDEPNEDRLYSYLREKKYTYISVGHRSTLVDHHQWLLRLSKDGTWELLETKDYEKEPAKESA
jgi:putative ATP-binding cassette transporter